MKYPIKKISSDTKTGNCNTNLFGTNCKIIAHKWFLFVIIFKQLNTDLNFIQLQLSSKSFNSEIKSIKSKIVYKP